MTTLSGACTIKYGPPSCRKLGTPVGRHDALALNCSLPLSSSSTAFFMTSFAHCFILGLDRSGICHVRPRTNGRLGSCQVGGADPGTGGNTTPKSCSQSSGPSCKRGAERGC